MSTTDALSEAIDSRLEHHGVKGHSVMPLDLVVDETIDYGDEIDNALEHHGIKGMHWGVRRSRDSSTGLVSRTSSADQIHADRIAGKISKGGTAAVSNKDLQDFSRRVQAEQEFSRAAATLAAQKGQGFIKSFLKNQGKRQFNRVADKAIDVTVERMLLEAGLKVGKKGQSPDVADTLVKVSQRLQPKKKGK